MPEAPSKTRKRTRENPEVRRAQILDEAILIVGERGYHGFTIQELAQRCGVSNAGLLYHFPSKDQLFLAMLQAYEKREAIAMAPVVDRARRGLEHNADSAVDVLDMFRTMVARGATQPHIGRLYMILQSETLDPSHPAHASFRARESAVLALFETLMSPFADSPKATARQLLALMDGLALQWLRGGQSFDIVAEWDRAIGILVPRLTNAARRGPLDAAPAPVRP
jgi:AcrR family transcriptional regulator